MTSTIPPSYSKLSPSLHRTLSTTDSAKCRKNAVFVILKTMSREEMCTVVRTIIAICVMIMPMAVRMGPAKYVLKRQSCGWLPVICATSRGTPAFRGPWTLATLNLSSAIHVQEESKETGLLAGLDTEE